MPEVVAAAITPPSVAMPMAAKKTVVQHKPHAKFAHDKEPQAAALVLVAYATGNALFVRRSQKASDHKGEWCFPGGMIEKGEPPVVAAVRETREETGFIKPEDIEEQPSHYATTNTGDVELAIYKLHINNEFIPTLDEDELDAYCWAKLDDPPQPIHTGLEDKGIIGQDADFRESDHPRDPDGKFGSGSGSSTKAIESLNDKFPVNPDNEKERMIVVGGKKVGTFEITEREGRLRIKGIDAIEPGSGVGGLLLRRILKAADKEGATVELTASSKGHQALSTTDLKAWYGRHGFVEEPGFDPALGYMIRKPSGAHDAAANQATHSELTNTIKFPPKQGPGGERAINIEFKNGSVGKGPLKESRKAWKLNTTTHDEKSSKTEASYTDGPIQEEPCKRCTMFILDGHCTAVEGDISPEGHCRFFEADEGAAKKDDDEIDSEIEQEEIHAKDSGGFKEEDHPRGQPDNPGQFASKEGGNFVEKPEWEKRLEALKKEFGKSPTPGNVSGKPTPSKSVPVVKTEVKKEIEKPSSPEAHEKAVRNEAIKSAKDLDWPESRLYFIKSADISSPSGTTSALASYGGTKITVSVDKVKDVSTLRAIMAHEINHGKLAYFTDYAVRKVDPSLKEKYKELIKDRQAIEAGGKNVSKYARSYWEGKYPRFGEKGSNNWFFRAMGESLAEMARNEINTGSTGVTGPLQELYKLIDDTWKSRPESYKKKIEKRAEKARMKASGAGDGLDSEFKEAEHPRDNDGKFTSGGGTGGGSFQGAPAEKKAKGLSKPAPAEKTPPKPSSELDNTGWAPSYIHEAEKKGAPTWNAYKPSKEELGEKHNRQPDIKLKDLEQVGKQLGSNPGGRYKDKNGNEYYIKKLLSPAHVKNERLAGDLFKLAGAGTLDYANVDAPDRLATRWQKMDKNNVRDFTPEERKSLQDDFAIHAWTANWDAAGLDYDNQSIKDGKVVSNDLGGALSYRAQGAPKGDKFGNTVGEWDTLRNKQMNPQNGSVFGGMSAEQLKQSAKRVTDIPDAAIRKAVKDNGLGDDMANKLIARKKDIAKKVGLQAADAAPKDLVGKFVVFEQPTVYYEKGQPKTGKSKLRGKVTRIMPNGEMEVRAVQGGYYMLKMPDIISHDSYKEVQHNGRLPKKEAKTFGSFIGSTERREPMRKSFVGDAALLYRKRTEQRIAMDRAILNSIRADGSLRLARLALDESMRSYDHDGRLHVTLANISKAAVNPYVGNEIPDFERLGLDPKKIYYLYRDPEELKKAAATFNGLPLLSQHQPVTADSHDHKLVVGSTGTNAVFQYPYLKNSLVVWPEGDIEKIEKNDKRQLSSGYRYTADMTRGVAPNGEKYDGVMRDIVGNHVALVEEGRAGPDVVVGDSKLRSKK